MERPGEGLVRRASRLEQELRQERRARAHELSEIRGFIGCESSSLGESLRSLQDRMAALERQLAEGLQRERLAREADVHELHDLLKHEIVAREGLSSSMHEALMSNLGVLPASAAESQTEQPVAEERRQPRVHFLEDPPADCSGSDSDNPEVTRSSLEEQLAGIKARMDRLEEIPAEHHQDDVHDLRHLLDCEQSAREEQLRSVEESLAQQLEGALASTLGMPSQERRASSPCKVQEGDVEQKPLEQKRAGSTSCSPRGSLGSKLQLQYMKLVHERAGGTLRRSSSRSPRDGDDLSADGLPKRYADVAKDSGQQLSSTEHARVEDQRDLLQWSTQQTV